MCKFNGSLRVINEDVKCFHIQVYTTSPKDLFT
jgi:hypothetical protein